MKKNLDELFIFPGAWLDKDSRDFALAARLWADREIVSKRLEYLNDYDNLYREKRRILIEDIGFQRLIMPEDMGGYGWNTPASAPGILTIFTEIGRADAAIGVVSAVKYAIFSIIAMAPNVDTGLCDALAPLFMDENCEAALILPGSGFAGDTDPLMDGRSIRVRIKETKAGYAVSGVNLRPFGPGATAGFICAIAADENLNPCICFIPVASKGVKRGNAVRQTGLNAVANTDVSFVNVKIPKGYVIRRDDAARELVSWLNLLLCGVSIGAAMNFFEILSDWAENRTIKGGSIMKENPLCASVLASVAEEIATARLLSYSLSHIMAHPGDWGGGGSAGIFTFSQMLGAKIQASCLNSINRGMELMGSAGYATEWHVEKIWRDIKTIQSWLAGTGSDAPVRMDIARFFYGCTEI